MVGVRDVIGAEQDLGYSGTRSLISKCESRLRHSTDAVDRKSICAKF